MGYMMRRFLPLLLTLAAALPAGAQSIRLTPYRAPTALYADLGRLFNYNLHEHARFEADLAWVLPNEGATDPKVFLGQWTLGGYVAYGVHDQAWKYGSSVSLRLPGNHDVRVGMSVKDDLEQAASRRMEAYNMVQTSQNTSYVASRFSHVQAVEGMVSWRFAPRWRSSVAARYSREQMLFGDSSAARYSEMKVRVDYKAQSQFSVLVQPGLEWSAAGTRPYVRTLAQYAYGDLQKGLHLWAQTGYATALQGQHPEAPETRRFDISGTGGTPYYFEHTFLTIPPNTLSTDLFAHLCAKYTAPEPLWQSSFSNPRAFLQANVAVLKTQDSKLLTLLEPATGFDGILRWGILDMGVAVAYRITPFDTINPTDNIAFAIVARLIV